MDSRKNEEILIEGAELAGLIASPNNNDKKTTSFSRTDSFSSKIISPKDINEDCRSFLAESAEESSHDSDDIPEGRRTMDTDAISVKGSEAAATKKCGKPQLTGWKRYLGMGLAILSSAIFSLAILIVKFLDGYQVFSIGLWRFQGVLIPSIPLILHGLCKKTNVFEPIHPVCRMDKFKIFAFLFLRAFFGCGAVLFHYNALKYLQIGDATTIAFSTPVFVTFMAYVTLGEQCGIINIFSAVLTFIGVAVITRPPFLTGAEKMDDNLLVGAGFALGSMLFATGVFLVLRMLRGVHYSLTTFFFGLYGSIECLILSIIPGVVDLPRDNWDWFLAVTLAVLTFFGQVFTTLAFQYEEAGPIALCRTCDVIFSFIWQFIFLSVVPDIFSFTGSLIVISGVFLVSFRKYVSSLPEKNGFRQKFWFVLK